MTFNGEMVFDGVRKVKYVYKPGSNNVLVIIFSGFSMPGKPPVYNYIQTLRGIDCHKLFILDDHNENHKTKATYYLGSNRSHDVEMSVLTLITKIANENNIPSSRIILGGSSKGAFAALYYGLKYSFGYVVCGGPSIFLGNYLIDRVPGAKGVAEYIAGDVDEESKRYLNSLIFNITINNYPDIHLHVGRGDPRYVGDVLPFLAHLDIHGIPYNLDLGDYSEHGEVGKHYSPFLISKVNSIIDKYKNEDLKVKLTEEKLRIVEERLNKIHTSKAWRYVTRYRETKKKIRFLIGRS